MKTKPNLINHFIAESRSLVYLSGLISHYAAISCSGVRIPLPLPISHLRSSVGRASASYALGHQFESDRRYHFIWVGMQHGEANGL